MQPSPMAEISNLLFPSLRFCIFESFLSVSHRHRFHDFLANHTPPPPKCNLHTASQAGASQSPERGCVEDQPQRFKNSIHQTHPEISRCSTTMFSDQEPDRPLLDCSRYNCVSPVHACCRA